MSRAIKYRVHEDKDKSTAEIQVRVMVIDNGFIIKAGGPPFFCEDEKALRSSIDDMLKRFLEQTSSENRDKP